MPIVREYSPVKASPRLAASLRGPTLRVPQFIRKRGAVIVALFALKAALLLVPTRHAVQPAAATQATGEGHGAGFFVTEASSLTPALAEAVRNELRSEGLASADASRLVRVVTDDGGSPYYGAAQISGDPGALARTKAVLFILPTNGEAARYIPVDDVDASRAYRVSGVRIAALLTDTHHRRRPLAAITPKAASAQANEDALVGGSGTTDGVGSDESIERIVSISPGRWTMLVQKPRS